MSGREGDHSGFRIVEPVRYGNNIAAAVNVPDDDAFEIRKLIGCRRIGDAHCHWSVRVRPAGLYAVY